MRGWAKAPVSGLGGVVFAVLLVALVLSAPVMAQTGKGKGKAAVVAAAAPAVVKGDAQRGAVKSEDERCQECHGADGHGFGQSASSEGRHPKLAGQSAAYIIKQLDNFRSGARKHDVMSMMARTVDPADIVDIAAYFASRPPMKGDGTGDSAAGRALYAPLVAWVAQSVQVIAWEQLEEAFCSTLNHKTGGTTPAQT